MNPNDQMGYQTGAPLDPNFQNQGPMPAFPQQPPMDQMPAQMIPPQAPQPPMQAIQAAGAAPQPGYNYAPNQMPPAPGYQAMPGGMPMQQMPGQMMPGQMPLTQAKKPVNQNSTQNYLQIAEIRDGIVIMNDGSYRAVVMVKSINFDLMSPQEREAVEYSYQGFLNSLSIPVQIFVRSQKVDLRQYLEKLDKIRTEHENMLLAVLMDDYIDYIDGLAAQTNIMDKRFYVTIPFFPVVESTKPLTQSKGLLDGIVSMFGNNKTHIVIDEAKLEEAKTELRNRVQAALSGLMQSGIQGLPLDTQELIELYYDSYNPDTATRQQLKNFSDLTVPVVTKGDGLAPQPYLERELG